MVSIRSMTADEVAAEYHRRARVSLLESQLPADDPAMIHGLAHLDGLDNAWVARTRGIQLRFFFDWCHAQKRPVFDIRRLEAKKYAAELRATLSPSTKRGRCKHPSAFYADAVDARLCPSNPFKGVGPGVVTNVNDTPSLTTEEIRRIYARDAALRLKPGYTITQERNFVMFKAMVKLGPRRAEVCGLSWGSQIVDAGRTQWRILGKGGTYANTALTKTVKADIANWRERLEADAGRPMRPREPIFPAASPGGRSFRKAAALGNLAPLKPDTLTIIFKEMLYAAEVGRGLPRYSPHSARATSITHAHEAGMSDKKIMGMSRHRRVDSMYRYITTPPGDSPAESWEDEIERDITPLSDDELEQRR